MLYVGHSNKINPNSKNSDYRYLKGFYLLKTIADFKTFSNDEYRYTTDYINMTTYKYEENITIPKDVLLAIASETASENYCTLKFCLIPVEKNNHLDAVRMIYGLESNVWVTFKWENENTIKLDYINDFNFLKINFI